MKHILSYGGGVNSSALYFYILDKGLPLDEVIFADTGSELEETYASVKMLQAQCAKDNTQFTIVNSKEGNIYNYYYDRQMFPYRTFRSCTDKFKIRPIRKYIRSKYGKQEKFTMYIGITWDEATRCKTSNVKYITHSYPFVDDKIDRKGNDNILIAKGFTATKSGCYFCPFQSKKSWSDLCKEKPDLFAASKKLEKNCSAYPKFTLHPSFALEKLERDIKQQKSLNDFDDPEANCDSINGGCFL